jgi:hypothetical protein
MFSQFRIPITFRKVCPKERRPVIIKPRTLHSPKRRCSYVMILANET